MQIIFIKHDYIAQISHSSIKAIRVHFQMSFLTGRDRPAVRFLLEAMFPVSTSEEESLWPEFFLSAVICSKECHCD